MRISANTLPLWVCVVHSMAFCAANVERKIQFANDFVANENTSYALFVRASCWTRFDMVRFALASNVPVQFIRNSIPEHRINDVANKAMFFVDMSCLESEKFLRQVCPLQNGLTFLVRRVLKYCLYISFLSMFLRDLLTAKNADKMEDSLFAFPYHWILFNVSLIGDRSLLDELRVLPDSDVTVVHYNDTTNDYRLQQSLCQVLIRVYAIYNFSGWFVVYKIDANEEVVTFEAFGRWSDETGLLDQRSTRILSRRRRDLLGRTISVSMVISNNDSLNHLTDYR